MASSLSAAPLGAVSLSPSWLAGAFGIGLVVTLVASWLPTRRVVAVSPLVALRPDRGVDVRTAAGRVRVALGSFLLLAGVALLGLAVLTTTGVTMVAGGGAAFTGVLLLGPVLMPALIRAIGAVVGRVVGPAGRLATGNAVRNPRRTATTTASLLIGVTLTTAVLTGLASSRGAVAEEMDEQYPIDVTMTATDRPLPGALLSDVRSLPDVTGAVAVPGIRAEVSDGVESLVLLAPPDTTGLSRGDVPRPGAREILLPYDVAAGLDRIRVTVDGQTLDLRVTAGDGWGAAGLIDPATLARLTDAPTTQAVWVRAADGTDADDLAGDVGAVATPAGAELASGLSNRAYVDLQLDVVTGAVVALLGIAVVIALVGIGNTLGLSVLERGRENALLRALGLTRRQLRVTLATEALLLSVVATLLGTGIGVAFAWAGVQPVVDTPVVLPWGQLALVVVVSAAAGLASCLLPARRAARVTPAAGLAMD